MVAARAVAAPVRAGLGLRRPAAGGDARQLAREGPPLRSITGITDGSRRGLWQRLFEQVSASGDLPPEVTLDSSHVKAHRSAAGGKGGSGSKRSGARAVGARARSIVWPMIAADRSRLR